MQFKYNQTIDILTRTPVVLRAMLQGLSLEWINSNEGEGTWSPFDVLGHLIHGEKTDWIPRAKIILEFGQSHPFEPFDRFAQFQTSKAKTIEELLDAFETLRSDNISILNNLNLNTQDLKKIGTHPELGRVTLEELLTTWAVHDLNHIVNWL
jgi:hypothetical protein